MIHQHPDGPFIQLIGPEAVRRAHGLIRLISETPIPGRKMVSNRQQSTRFPRPISVHHRRVIGRESRQRDPNDGEAY